MHFHPEVKWGGGALCGQVIFSVIISAYLWIEMMKYSPERLLTFHEAADVLGVHYWQIQRAVKRGDIPSYTPFNSRKLVKLSEVVTFIEASRQGGGEHD